jgi:hypothetical protein
MATTNTQREGSQPVGNAVKLLGEAVLPGASLILDGNVVSGGAHLLVGALAGAAFGPIGVVLAMANSYARSTTGKGLLKQFSND